MTVKDLIQNAFGHSDLIIRRYLDGLGKSDLLIRAVPGMNHIAWQVGHLIAGEKMMVDMIRPGCSPPLPEGFEAHHSSKNTSDDDPSHFLSPEEYLALWDAQRPTTLALIASLPEEEFDREEPGVFPPFAPTVAGSSSWQARMPSSTRASSWPCGGS